MSKQINDADVYRPYQDPNVLGLLTKWAPDVYNHIDLQAAPERFRFEPGPNSIIGNSKRIKELLADPSRVEMFRQLTLMGDPLADAYAALIPSLGFKKVRDMLDQAVEQGVAAVEDAPAELVALMRSVEQEPDWVDWKRIDRATHDGRIVGALAGEAIIRVSFMMTYVNGYQGLPMVITGALTGESAAKRMKETISTFKLATLPGALRQGGIAYQSALKVRLMHAMVRTSLLKRPQAWNFEVYGVPIPQVDQMGAALGISYMMAQRALKRPSRQFTETELCTVEQSRYLAHLLGMHEQFLSNDPQQIVDTWRMCQATLRHSFDERGKQLNSATLNAYRRENYNLFNRFMHSLDTGATRFMYTKMVGRKTAKTLGVESSAADSLKFLTYLAPVAFGTASLLTLSRLGLDKWIDRFSVKQVEKQLANNGPAEYHTDSSQYKM